MDEVLASVSYRQKLIQQLHHADRCNSSVLEQAFFEVPRHHFIDAYYKQQGHGLLWEFVTKPERDASVLQWETWFEAMYQDTALVTQLDLKGRPTSSSSMPSVMALMLETLEIAPGHRVLEIGTGTGYNAALLAYLTHNPDLVSSIELDPYLATRAKKNIDRMIGVGVHVYVGNALRSISGTLYDRILATGSYRSIPRIWLKQLNSDGVLVMEARGDFGGALFKICKKADGSFEGHIQGWEFGFMTLRQSLEFPRTISVLEVPSTSSKIIPYEDFSMQMLDHPGLAVWLQHSFPSVSLQKHFKNEVLYLYLTDAKRKTTIVLEQDQQHAQWNMTVHGTAPLWEEIQSALHQWEHLGQPQPQDYRLLINQFGDVTLKVV